MELQKFLKWALIESTANMAASACRIHVYVHHLFIPRRPCQKDSQNPAHAATPENGNQSTDSTDKTS